MEYLDYCKNCDHRLQPVWIDGRNRKGNLCEDCFDEVVARLKGENHWFYKVHKYLTDNDAWYIKTPKVEFK